MRRYIVLPIQDIIDNYDKLKKGKTVTIFITSSPYPFLPTLRLGFDDVFKGEPGFIYDYEIHCILNMMPILKKQDTIIVGCDAGLSRSPAVALGIAYHLGDEEQMKDLWYDFRFTNTDVYEAIKKM